jgi:2Fe-2S ferredoxin
MTADKIRFEPTGLDLPFETESSVLEVALRHGVEIPHSCGGMGSCTTCRVIVLKSPHPLPPRNDLEQDIAEMRSFTDSERLSCQLPPSPGLIVRLPGLSPSPRTT